MKLRLHSIRLKKRTVLILVFWVFIGISYYSYQIRNLYLVDYGQFLVSNRRCRVNNLNPFSNEAMAFFKPLNYLACTDKPLLTSVRKEENKSVLYIDKDLAPLYCTENAFFKLSCCYSNVSRKSSETNPDDYIKISQCEDFNDVVDMVNDIVMINCKCGYSSVYENVHVALNINENVKKKMISKPDKVKPINVLFIGIDSVSRLNFIRALPKTYKYVEDKNWLGLLGYNKVDDNTFPNLMAILTGFNLSYTFDKYNPRVVGMLDKCPLLWYDFRRLGYITAFAEDEGSLNTFNHVMKGFAEPPADYYFRPYVLATEKLSTKWRDFMTYCTGPETAGERIMNIAKDFAITFQKYPHFGFFWMNSFSHNDLSSVSGMDNRIKLLLTDLENSNVTSNSIVIFLSDHGIRFGSFRLATETGWLEERLPFIYFSMPPWFQKEFPSEFENLKNNARKLTTPYDLYMTLQHILVLSGLNYTITPSNACPQCKSLFEEIDVERSCEDAGVAQHWCTCAGYNAVKLDETAETMVTDYLLNEIYKLTSNATRNSDGGEQCAKYELGTVLSTSSAKNNTYILVKIETIPKAVFEATLEVQGDISDGQYSSVGDISRLDSYQNHSYCLEDAFLKKYCYCS